MNDSTAISPITEFILGSERNLRVAKAVYSEWEAAREALAKDFCNRLRATLKKKLPGWSFDSWTFLAAKRGAFFFLKPGWVDQYSFELNAYDWGEHMTYGIVRDENTIGNRPFSSDLLNAIRKRVASAKSKKWYEAVMDLHEPDSDWSKPDVLWQMKTSDAFLEKVAFQLLELAQLSETIVDSLVAKYSRTQKKS